MDKREVELCRNIVGIDLIKGADHLTLEGGGEGEVGDFEKKISCECLSEEKNCVQHKCNRKLMGKKGKKISCSPDLDD